MRTVISVADHWLRMTWFWQPLIVWNMSPILLHSESLLVSCVRNLDGLYSCIIFSELPQFFLASFLTSLLPSILSSFLPSLFPSFLSPFLLRFRWRTFSLLCSFVCLMIIASLLCTFFLIPTSLVFLIFGLSHFKLLCLNQSFSLCF